MNKMQDEIIDGLKRLNGDGLTMVHAILAGALMNPNFCSSEENAKGDKIINLLFCERKNSKYSAFFKQLDKSESGKVINFSRAIKAVQ